VRELLYIFVGTHTKYKNVQLKRKGRMIMITRFFPRRPIINGIALIPSLDQWEQAIKDLRYWQAIKDLRY
jgi:hypothetical protein